MRKQHICILGASGFVGTHLTARLVKEGHHITALTRNRERNRHLLVLPTVRVLTTDVHDADALENHLAGCDVVINLIGLLNQNRKEKFSTAHVELAQKMLAAAKKNGVKRILHVSALKADAKNAPSEYLKTKGQAQDLLMEQTDVGVTIFQPSLIFGPDDSFINRFADLLRIPVPWFLLPTPNTRFAPVYVGDVVSAIVASLNDRGTIGKTFELCGPKVLSLKEIVLYIRDRLGKDTRIIGLGQGLSKFVAWMLEWIPGKPMSVDNFQSMQVHSICSTSGLEKLGITSTTMESIVPNMLAQSDRKGRLSDYRRDAGR